MEGIKVLVFYNQMLDSFLGSGGDIRCAQTIKRWRGLRVSVLGPSISRFLKEELGAEKYFSLPRNFLERLYQKLPRVFIIGPIYILRAFSSLKILKEQKYDLLYTTGDFICNTFPAFWIKRKNSEAKWVANIFHINLPPTKREKNKFLFALGSFLLQRVSFFLLKRADLIFLLNNGVKKSLVKMGFNPEKLIVLGGGVDITKIKRIKPKKPKRKNVIFLGRLNLTKGIFDLPKIWPLVLEKVPEAKLILIGAGEEKIIKDLKEKFMSVGVLDSVEFRGFIQKNEDVYKILKTGKVFILPSYEEGWGIVVFEAIACGLAPITYNLPVFKEIFGENIQVVTIGNTIFFAKTIIKFLSNESLRRKYVFGLNKKIKRYDWDKIANRELELIKRLQAGNLVFKKGDGAA